ncbi:hypothetical protein GPECTOR_12g413 [Gonium pectorale]|uniref:Dymeclin n=1 Tax=Gonium pectorale TaxID=33097 RepID=A0A150GQ36_GONPE|nr:hypothetical protein GPECTOR_12g413 [Gonium pectorale]|eukprot:KXZ51450.1 hypothetical protein GPECTOR_12g413 [Gonium pectorale]
MASSGRAVAAARGGRGSAAGAAVASDAGRLPPGFRAALQSLGEEVDRLFATGSSAAQPQDSDSPLSRAGAAQLRKLDKALEVLSGVAKGSRVGRSEIAAAILTWPPGRPALLRLLAAVLRLPASDLVAGFSAAEGSTRCLRTSITHRTVGLVVALASYAVETALVPVQAFLRAAMQTQALHAASRQLAALAGELAAPAAGALHYPFGAGGEAGGEAGADELQGGKDAVIGAATIFLVFTFGLIRQTVSSLTVGAPTAPPDRLLFAELVEALESSAVLEHAARLLVLVLVLRRSALPTPDVRKCAFQLFIFMHTLLASLYCSTTDADAATVAMGARLHAVLCGRCVTHAALVLGLSTLAPADGGSSYGLDEIVRRPAVRAVAGEYCGPSSSGGLVRGAGQGAGSGPTGRDTFLAMVMLLHIIRSPTAGPPAVFPCRRGAFSLALRAGRLEVASAAAAAQASGSGPPSPPPVGAPPRVMSWLAALQAFEAAALQLYPLHPSGGWSAATGAEAEVELWHLGVSTLRWALSLASEDGLRSCCRCLEVAWRRAERDGGVQEECSGGASCLACGGA